MPQILALDLLRLADPGSVVNFPLARLLDRAVPLLRGKGLRGRLVRGGIGSLGINTCAKVLGLGVAIVLARALGPDGYGLYAYVFVLVSLLSLPAQMGLPTLVVRETARAQAAGNWGLMRGVWRWSSTAAAGLVLVIATGGYFIGEAFADRFTDLQMTTFGWALLLVPLTALGNLRGAALRGLRHIVEGLLPEHILRPFLFIALVLMSSLLWSPVEMTAATAMALHAVAAFIAFLIGAWLLWRCRPAALSGVPRPVYAHREWLKATLPLSLLSAMQLVNMHVGVLILGLIGTAADVALLRIALQTSSIVILGQNAINMLIAPYITIYYGNSQKEKLKRIATYSAFSSFIIALPLSVLIFMRGDSVLTILFGAAFSNAWLALSIVVGAQLLNTTFGPVSLLLNMTGFERDSATGVAFSALANILFGILLIPPFGLHGAAIAMGISILTWNCYLSILVYKRVGVVIGIFAPLSSTWR